MQNSHEICLQRKDEDEDENDAEEEDENEDSNGCDLEVGEAAVEKINKRRDKLFQ